MRLGLLARLLEWHVRILELPTRMYTLHQVAASARGISREWRLDRTVTSRSVGHVRKGSITCLKLKVEVPDSVKPMR